MAALLDLPLETLLGVCLHLDLHDLVRVAETCKRFRHGEGGLETVELPTMSPVVTALLELAFPRRELARSSRPVGFPDSWVSYLARCVQQGRCLEAPLVAAGREHSLFVDATGRLLACGRGFAAGYNDEDGIYSSPVPMPAMAGVRMQSVAAGSEHSLTLGWDGRVYSWGRNWFGQLGHGDTLDRRSPTLMKGLEGVCGISAGSQHNLAVTHLGAVSFWGRAIPNGEDLEDLDEDLVCSPWPMTVEGLDGGAHMRRVRAGAGAAFAIGEDRELFSWGEGRHGRLGHGDTQDQPSPKRVEALQGVRVSRVAAGMSHTVALTEDGVVYAWGVNETRAMRGNHYLESKLQPKPVEALQGLRVRCIVAAPDHSYALADTDELWAWGVDVGSEPINCPPPKPIESLRGITVDVVAVGPRHTLAMADHGSAYVWGQAYAAKAGALGLGVEVSNLAVRVPTPQRISELRAACGQ
jgi:alpha-tubulin suppressor-like RCC1 family protein